MAHAPTQPLTRPGSSTQDSVEVDLGNMVPLIRVGICLAVALAVPWCGLHTLRHVAPKLLPQRLAGLGYAQEIQARVDGAAAQYREGRVSSDEYLCAVLGFSGGQEGIDIGQLAQEDGLPVRYLGFCGACDGTMGGLTKLVNPLYESELRPDLVILAMNPFHLVVRPFQASLQRADIKHGVDVQLARLRRQILHLFQVGVDPRFQQQDPWRGMTKNYFEPIPAWLLELRVEEYGKRGYFDASKYQNSNEQRLYLHQLVQRSRTRGAEMLIVLMPIHPTLYDCIPASATQALRATLQQAFGENAPPILDYQQAMGAQAFYDASHLNGEGRATFTSILARDIPRHVPRHAPRMKHLIDGQLSR